MSRSFDVRSHEDHQAGVVPSPNNVSAFSAAAGRGRRWRLVLVVLVVVGVLLGSLAGARAELGTTGRQIAPALGYIYGLAWGDMDADGDLDVVIASDYYDDDWYPQLLVYENVGGDFVLYDDVSTALEAGGLAWGDVDGDGDLDIAMGGAIFANQGTGFSKIVDLQIYGDPTWVDYDGDGDLDLSLNESLYRNDNGTFSTTPVRQWPSVPGWGDADGDGDLDVAVVRDDGFGDIEVRVLRNNAGIFNLLWSASLPYSWDYADMLTGWGDVDGDGDLDLAVAGSEGNSEAIVLRNNGGTFVEIWQKPISVSDLTWGDYNSDGFADLALSTCVNSWMPCGDDNGAFEPVEVYGTDNIYASGSQTLTAQPVWSGPPAQFAEMVDMDADGDLDVSSAINYSSPYLSLNSGFGIARESYDYNDNEDFIYSSTWGNLDSDPDLELIIEYGFGLAEVADFENGYPQTIQELDPPSRGYWNGGTATADWDGDGDLDFAIGDAVYRNTGNSYQLFWSLPEDQSLSDPLWADWDGSGDPELLLTDGTQLYLYGYSSTLNTFVSVWSESPEEAYGGIEDYAWGDLDNDGDPDLAVARGWGRNQLYENTGGALVPVWRAETELGTMQVGWGDVDGDGDLELAFDNIGERLQVYDILDGVPHLIWESVDFNSGWTYDFPPLDWVDFDADGDLDLAGHRLIYENKRGQLSAEGHFGGAMHWADWDADGDMDVLELSNFQWGYEVIYYTNKLNNAPTAPHATYLTIDPLDVVAEGFASSYVFRDSIIPIDFTIFSNHTNRVGRIEAFYSLNGGGKWEPATPVAGTQLTHLAADADGVDHVFEWDVEKDGIYGLYNDVVFRIDVYTHAADPAPAGTYKYTNVASDSFQRPGRASARTTSFRVRGTSVRVVDENGDAATGAMVYRLKAGETVAELIGNGQGRFFTTDGNGFLQGHGELDNGDKLFALYPVEEGPNGQYTVYHTSGAATATGVDWDTVSGFATQTLTVSADNPLILYNLIVSLEWDARRDPSFLSRLESDLHRTSQILYDLTDGQAALGQVDIYHDKGYWGIANIVVPAANDVRPAATLGGIVHEETDDIALSGPIEKVYVPGQVRIGPTWNRFGDADGTLGEDWPRTLAHELGHYLFFLPDNYLGLSPSGRLELVDCPGSVMTNPYLDSYSEFLTPANWGGDCLNTLAEKTFGRADWETIGALLRYSGGGSILRTPNPTNAGPSSLPLGVTQVSYYGPTEEPTVLAAPFFPVQNEHGQPLAIPAGRSQAYLIKRQRQADGTGYETAATERYVVPLGSVVGDLIQARGATPGDRLCVFDYSQTPNRNGCITVGNGPMPVRLYPVADYSPVITVKGFPDSKTVEVTVSNVGAETALSVQVLPALGVASAELAMTKQANGTFKRTITTPDHAFYGYVRVWVPGATNPPEETIVAFNNVEAWQGYSYAWGGYSYAWGNPSVWGGYAYAWGGYAYAWGGYAYAWGAPVMSNDGQVSFLPKGDALFGPPEPLSMQSLPVPPDLPTWLTPVGQAYRLQALEGATLTDGAVLFRYLARDVPAGLEDHLTIYFQQAGATTWQELETTRQTEYNHAVAEVAGSGIYALVARVQLPNFLQGWNTFSFPVQGLRPVAEALAAIEGKYTSVYHFNGADWELFDAEVDAPFAALVNDLTHLVYPRTYWLYAKEPVTLYLSGDPTAAAIQADGTPNRYFPPATYYGWVTPGAGFTPAAGMAVTAEIDGVVCGQSTVQSYGGQLAYVIQVQAESIMGPPDGCGRANRAITFTINGQAMTTPGVLWDNAKAQRRDLSTTSSGSWTSDNVGSGSSGTTTENGGQVTINATGNDIAGANDSFRYAYRTASGDLELVARLTGWNANSNPFAKAGIMLRATTNADAPTFLIHLTGQNNRPRTKWRSSAGETITGQGATNDPGIPQWLKLKKVGNSVTAFYSADGVQWTQIGDAQTVLLGDNFLYGMAVTSNSPGAFVNATFDSITTSVLQTPVAADFSAPTRSGVAPLTVNFSDQSTGSPTSWAWSFGDGATSTQRNPSHTYTTPGTYTVSLTASKPGSSDTETKTGYVTVSSAPTGPNVFYVSPAKNKKIGGIAATSADILRYEKSTNTWTLIYDGSLVGTPKNVAAFHIMDDGSLLLVFGANQKLPGSSVKATPLDVVKFTPDNPNSQPYDGGSFAIYWRGSEHGLTKTSKKIDALDFVGNSLLLSITGAAQVSTAGGSLSFGKEDVAAFNMTTNQWETPLTIDGSTIPELAKANIDSVWDDPNSGAYYVIMTGAYKLGGVKGTPKNIVKLTPSGNSFTPSFVDWLAPGVKLPTNLDGLDMGG